MDTRRRRQPRYRDLGPAIGLLASLVVVAAGLAATRVGWITVEIKVGLGPRFRVESTAVAASAPASGPSPVAPVVTPAAISTSDATAPPATAPPAPALVPTAEAAPPPSECATGSGPTNVDPTAGDIRGMTGLPDHVTYFKHRAKTGCPSSARSATAPSRSK